MTILQIGAGSIGWKVAGFHGSNEVMFHNGVDLTGEQAPTLIPCGSQATRGKLLALVTRTAFEIAQARRRNLAFTACRRGGDTLVFDLEVGQRAVVRPIQSEHFPEHQRWEQLVLPPSVP